MSGKAHHRADAAFVEFDRSWMADAACRGADPEAFFPQSRGPSDPFAVRICQSCPVREACLRYAEATGASFGIWGGLNTEQRNRRRREQQGV